MSDHRWASEEAEQAVLGACLCDPEMTVRLATVLAEADFESHKHRVIWDAMMRLYERRIPTDILTVSEEIAAIGKTTAADEVYLSELISAVPAPQNAPHYAKIVAEFATRRRMLDAARQAASKAFDQNLGVEEMMAEIERIVSGATTERNRREAMDMDAVVDQYLATFHDGPGPLIEFGVANVDKLIGGVPRRNLVVIAGRPSIGKSAFGTHVALHNAIRGKRVIYMNLETDEEELFARFASNLAKINSRKIAMKGMAMNGEYSLLEEVMEYMRKLPIVIDSNATGELGDVVSRVRHLHHRAPCDLVIVDHMALMSAQGHERNRVQEMSTISRGMKRLAMEIERPVFALHQLSRAGASRNDPRPILTDLRDSGSIEQDGDLICFLHREGYYKLGVDPERTELIVAKYRNGPTGAEFMRYDMRHNTFWPWDSERGVSRDRRPTQQRAEQAALN